MRLLNVEIPVNHFCGMNWCEWFCTPINFVSIGMIVLFLGFLFLYYRGYGKRKWFSDRLFKIGGILIFMGGCVLYFIGFFWEGTKDSLIALLCRSALSSLEMFVSHSDLLEVDLYWKENAVYMTFFAVIHFLAVLFSAVFIIHYFRIRLVSWMRLRVLKWGGSENLYVFWGVNESSINLAKDIHKKDEKKKAIIFMELPGEEEHGHVRLSFSHLFGHFNCRPEWLDEINSLNAILIRGRYSPANYRGVEHDLLKKMGWEKLVRRVRDVYFFLLSDDENFNILSVLNLKSDQCLVEKCGQQNGQDVVHLFCLARRESVNDVFESESANGLEIKVIDTAYLAVLSLKSATRGNDKKNKMEMCRRYLYHPIDYVDVDTENGLAKSDFTSMIVGFGTTGQEALRFLLEYGQFPYDGTMGTGPHFRCHVVDAKMNSLKERFLTKAPALRDPAQGITFHEMSDSDRKFWKCLDAIVRDLNYVVIALGDDESGISLAVDIYDYVRRYRGKELGKFRIFVRAYEKNNEQRLDKIAGCYRDGITIFGASSKIFVKELIIDAYMLEMAQKFNSTYETQDDVTSITPEELWRDRRDGLYRKLQKQIQQGKYNDIKAAVDNREMKQGLRRKESQNFSNVFHIYTKMRLAGILLDHFEQIEEAFRKHPGRLDEIKGMLELSKMAVADGNEQERQDWEQKIVQYFQAHPYLENMARCEHERWCAAHYVLGYVKMVTETYEDETCCEKQMVHLCLVPWDELPNLPGCRNFQHNDRTVVRTSFRLMWDMWEKSKENQ